MAKKQAKGPLLPRFIAVPYEDKDRAKAAGAKWHPAAKRWHIPEGMDRAAFPWKDDYVNEAEWQHILAKEAAERQSVLKRQRHRFFKTNAEANKPTRQILAEGKARLHHLLSE